MHLCTQHFLGDSSRFNQVLTNLLGNAIKFTQQGQVSISLEGYPANEGKTRIRVQVQDTGIGIAEHALNALFKPFSQTDNSITREFGGTGLGLAISKQLVELMDGRIGVQSSPEEGSTFWFDLELVETEEVLERVEAPMLVHKDMLEGIRILVVEDNMINQKLVAAFLSETGCKLDHAYNGEEAVKAAATAQYDIILMDIQMPVMDGVTATRHIRDLPGPASQVFIIALTASAMVGDRERFFSSGVNDYVTKPVNRRTLIAHVLQDIEILRSKKE